MSLILDKSIAERVEQKFRCSKSMLNRERDYITAVVSSLLSLLHAGERLNNTGTEARVVLQVVPRAHL